jgi:Rrf2 family transcriptional regulator, cysteine metabolism repressor
MWRGFARAKHHLSETKHLEDQYGTLRVKLTTKSEYSLLALIYIARRGADDFVKIEDICTAYDIPKKYLEQLFITLREHGFIRTRRGSRGGYQLTRPAGAITVAEIIRLMDGALAPSESVSKYFFSHTPLEKEKKVIAVLKDIRNYISRTLETKTLHDLI